jgi:hypothetical protein
MTGSQAPILHIAAPRSAILFLSFQGNSSPRRTQTAKSQIQKKETRRLNLCENYLFKLKARKTICRGVIIGQK